MLVVLDGRFAENVGPCGVVGEVEGVHPERHRTLAFTKSEADDVHVLEVTNDITDGGS